MFSRRLSEPFPSLANRDLSFDCVRFNLIPTESFAMNDEELRERQRFQDELVLAREIGRPILPPEFPGFTVTLNSPKVNLWTRQLRRANREFADAFVTRHGNLMMTVCTVFDQTDSIAQALSIRGFFRGRLLNADSLDNVFKDFQTWQLSDSYWNGMCHIAIAHLQPDRRFAFASIGFIELQRQRLEAEVETLNESTLPFVHGSGLSQDPPTVTEYKLQPDETYSIRTFDEEPEEDDSFFQTAFIELSLAE